MFVFFMPLLQFAVCISGAQRGDLFMPRTVRTGEDVTLSCENVADAPGSCNSTTWRYTNSRQAAAITLAEHGRLRNTSSDRLSVSADCSLVVTKATAEDAGLYICQQFVSGTSTGRDAVVPLSVVYLNEHQDKDRVTLNCSLSMHGRCHNRVKWLLNGKDLDRNNKAIIELPSSCSAAVTFHKTYYIYRSTFKCKVKIEEGNVQLFTFSSRPPVESTTAMTKNSTTSTASSLKKTPNLIKPGTSTSKPVGKKLAEQEGLLWFYVTVPLVTMAIIITVVLLIILKRAKVRKIQHSSSDVDPEDVTYASISFTKKSNNSSRIKSKDAGDAVIYSTLKAPSTDHSSF